MQTYVMTIPRTVSKRALRIMIEKNDCKKWIIGKEIGKNGYKHWQIRIETSNDSFFEWIQDHIPTAHVEKSDNGVDECEYETKEGQFIRYSDRTPVLIQRYGAFRPNQKRALQALGATNDRQVVVWYDETGNVGKSWFTGALWERGLAYVTPPTIDTVKGLIQWVASCYMDGGFRPYVIIDIPRSWKWSEQLYSAIESIKDGLIYDTRYHSRMINIRGVKVLVMTNTMPKLDKLSQDRWCICTF
ncbi:replication-associated protein [Human associated porprismacovirus 3]|uniref:Replication-associated protein n=1 Tax=Human associated porprismacovirus 3 TaxID=2496633 RepID=A0A515J4K0_9VIRU|nr:replication-associated protein [Human associated porprismacovirus 3]QDM14411.1 replication-associated protein [Human associated porprismacovirus 3]